MSTPIWYFLSISCPGLIKSYDLFWALCSIYQVVHLRTIQLFDRFVSLPLGCTSVWHSRFCGAISVCTCTATSSPRGRSPFYSVKSRRLRNAANTNWSRSSFDYLPHPSQYEFIFIITHQCSEKREATTTVASSFAHRLAIFGEVTTRRWFLVFV